MNGTTSFASIRVGSTRRQLRRGENEGWVKAGSDLQDASDTGSRAECRSVADHSGKIFNLSNEYWPDISRSSFVCVADSSLRS